MPDDYDAVRKDMSRYERGLYFELGRAHELGETRDRGWVPQFAVETGKGRRILDNARTSGRGVESRERKSGRVNEREARVQLDKERAGIESGLIVGSRWETVAGEKVPEKTLEQMRTLSGDTKGKFQHVVVSREAATRAIMLGQSLASQQLELIKPYELQRAERARERLANIRQLVKEKQDRERIVAAEVVAARRAALEFPTPEQLKTKEPVKPHAKEPSTPETERDRVAREAAETAVRDVQKQFGIEPKGKVPEGASPDRADQKLKAELQIQRETREAQLAMLPPHVAKLVDLGVLT
ncbi:hypothetical protein [Nocardia brasiliensis]|uniref:hypothetical protein n=1 Tax=Nocardia brasiliensis TaxID=37326 RepID=UPI00245813F1|nr:hypothetical protein [Nocardia brasiliensis]